MATPISVGKPALIDAAVNPAANLGRSQIKITKRGHRVIGKLSSISRHARVIYGFSENSQPFFPPAHSAKIHSLFSRLRAARPRPTTELRHLSPFELLVAVILSAQSTDKKVNEAIKKSTKPPIGCSRSPTHHRLCWSWGKPA